MQPLYPTTTRGNEALARERPVALLCSRHAPPEAIARADAIADALARLDIPQFAPIGEEYGQAIATAAKRHAGPCLLVSDQGSARQKMLGSVRYDGNDLVYREPVPASRVWGPELDSRAQLYLTFSQPYSGASAASKLKVLRYITQEASAVLVLWLDPADEYLRELLRARVEIRDSPTSAWYPPPAGGAMPEFLRALSARTNSLECAESLAFSREQKPDAPTPAQVEAVFHALPANSDGAEFDALYWAGVCATRAQLSHALLLLEIARRGRQLPGYRFQRWPRR